MDRCRRDSPSSATLASVWSVEDSGRHCVVSGHEPHARQPHVVVLDAAKQAGFHGIRYRSASHMHGENIVLFRRDWPADRVGDCSGTTRRKYQNPRSFRIASTKPRRTSRFWPRRTSIASSSSRTTSTSRQSSPRTLRRRLGQRAHEVPFQAIVEAPPAFFDTVATGRRSSPITPVI